MDVLSSSQRQNAKIVMVTKIFGGMERHPPSGNRREIKKITKHKLSTECEQVF